MKTMTDTAKVIEVLGDIACDLTSQTFIKAVELYRDLHGIWPTKLYLADIEDLQIAGEIVRGSPWEKMVIIVDDPPQFRGWGVGISYDHLVGSEGA